MRFIRACLVTAIASAGALWGCGDETDDGVPPGATLFTLTPSGGVFLGEGPLAGVRLDVPPGAVDADFDLWMAPPEVSPPLPETGQMVGPEVLFGPSEVALAEPAQLTLPFDLGQASLVGAERFEVKVWRNGPDGWEIDEPVQAPEADEVTVEIVTLGHFGAGVEIE